MEAAATETPEGVQSAKPAKRLILVRRESGGVGGAEAVVARFKTSFEAAGWHVTLLQGRQFNLWGPSWLRALQFANKANTWLKKHAKNTAAEGAEGSEKGSEKGAQAGAAPVVFSLERGIHAHMYRAGDGVHRAWLKLRYGVQGNPWRAWFNPLHHIMPRLEATSIAHAQAVVANSERVKQDLMDAYPAAEAAGKLRVIYNGANTATYTPPTKPKGALRAALNLPATIQPKAPLLLFCGSGWQRKGLAEAIHFLHICARSIKATAGSGPHLIIVGRGKPGRYKALAKKLGMGARVHFLGPQENAAPYYQAADGMVLPTAYDPFSNACLEALHCGCPVLTTETNGAAEVLKHSETGYILEATPEGRREAAAWWLRQRPVPSVIASSVAGLNLENELAQYLEILETLINVTDANASANANGTGA